VTVRLLVTSGRGPAECRIAISKVLDLIRREAAKQDVDVTEIEGPHHAQGHGPASVVVVLDGPEAKALARTWIGTIQWIAQSPVRPNHRRKNWFVSVSELEPPPLAIMIDLKDVRFETFRAGGPGGQHQNTTDSAVRAIHIPTGTRAVARDERSQHRNRETAIERLCEIIDLGRALKQGELQQEAQARHDSLERGNPVRVLR
jgi:peptide chain release factor